MNADLLINHYVRLNDEQRTEFDRRYNALKALDVNLARIAGMIAKMTPDQLEAARQQFERAREKDGK